MYKQLIVYVNPLNYLMGNNIIFFLLLKILSKVMLLIILKRKNLNFSNNKTFKKNKINIKRLHVNNNKVLNHKFLLNNIIRMVNLLKFNKKDQETLINLIKFIVLGFGVWGLGFGVWGLGLLRIALAAAGPGW